jgi:hypothetical protein
MSVVAAVLALSLGGSSACEEQKERWGPAGVEPPCSVFHGTVAERREAARARWGLRDEQLTCALEATSERPRGFASGWRVCVEGWPEVVPFWAALLAEGSESEVPFERLSPDVAQRLYAVPTRHARRVADLLLAARPAQLASVLGALEPEEAFDLAWLALERSAPKRAPAEWDALGVALLRHALLERWLTFSVDVWRRLPSPTRTRLATQPLLARGARRAAARRALHAGPGAAHAGGAQRRGPGALGADRLAGEAPLRRGAGAARVRPAGRGADLEGR